MALAHYKSNLFPVFHTHTLFEVLSLSLKNILDMGRDHKPLKWSPEEDEKLIHFIKEHKAGTWDWASLPERAGLRRSSKSCNSRWNDHLRDDFRSGTFTKVEEEIFVRLHNSGSSLATIAKYFPGRSTIEIKNYWKSNLVKRVCWNLKPDGTSELVILPIVNHEKETKSSWANEPSTSISSSAAGKVSEMNLKWSGFEEHKVNNSLAEYGNLIYKGNSSGTVGQELATDIFSNILADGSNYMNYGGDGGGSFEYMNSWTAGSNWFSHEERAMVISNLDESSNLGKEVDRTLTGVAAVREMERSSEPVELFSEPVSSNAPQGDLIVNTPTGFEQGIGEGYDEFMVTTPGLLYGDLGWNDAYFLDQEEYFMGSMEHGNGHGEGVVPREGGAIPGVPDQTCSNMHQGDMTLKIPADFQDDNVGGHDAQPSSGLDSVHSMFSGGL